MGGVDVDGRRIDFEMDEPVGGDWVAILLGWREFPEFGGLEAAVGEELAGAAGIDGGFGDLAGGVGVNFYGDADGATDGGAGGRAGVG